MAEGTRKVNQASELHNKCVELIKGACLTQFANAIHDSPGTYIADPLRVVPAEEASGHLAALERVRARVADARTAHYHAAHEIALADDAHMTFLSSGQSVDLDEIDNMGHREFERLTAILMYRDGYRVERSGGGAGDLGADVIASHRTRGLVVLQCKHPPERPRSIRAPCNGSAAPDVPSHRADTVIALTNGTFTRPARNLATGQRIHCFGRLELRRWATWGDRLVDILESTRTWNHATGHPQEA
ncbi:restriction endonuclease [Embleya sp. NPDC008237]|uniref:restriction endonuclease n=1 Tax=Embleya sp. NPDC008237 TaxID=3363978 RepID=UPI0036EF531E